MTNYSIILMVTVIAFVACAILAVIIKRIDKNADRRDSRN
jgi:hypothetical protein